MIKMSMSKVLALFYDALIAILNIIMGSTLALKQARKCNTFGL